MRWFIHSSSLRYALALWLATVLALLIAFVVQLEPAQWAGITVWIVFIQPPRMNYSKIIWWAFGTIVGAFMAVNRLSTLEHTLDVTTAETADSRIHAPLTRSLVATLFDLLAKAQAVEVHLSRLNAVKPSAEVAALLARGEKLLADFAATISPGRTRPADAPVGADIEALRSEVAAARQTLSGSTPAEAISNHFLLDRLDEILEEFSLAGQDWHGLFEAGTARRTSHLAVHHDYLTAFIYGLRMFLAMGIVSAIWFITQWPSGSQLVLFTAVVCSLLSLVDHAPLMGLPFLKSAAFCAMMAYVQCFWLQQKGEGFLMLALMLGLFLLPAAYAYRHPRLIGGAVVSMLIFYGLSNPANQMNYDIIAFLNNGLALLCATTCGFFAFHAVPSLDAKARQFWLLRAVRHDLARVGRGGFSEQSWTSRMFGRLRLLHRAAGDKSGTAGWLEAENEMLISLQLGMRQRRLHAQLKTLPPGAARTVAEVLREFYGITLHPNIVTLILRSIRPRLEEAGPGEKIPAGGRAEIWEMTHLLETSTRFYLK